MGIGYERVRVIPREDFSHGYLQILRAGQASLHCRGPCHPAARFPGPCCRALRAVCTGLPQLQRAPPRRDAARAGVSLCSVFAHTKLHLSLYMSFSTIVRLPTTE